ncbi:MAG: SUMF1/EgtB/PvdO family nonheme iron enzyme [Nitrososphaerales archaeon]
MNNGSITGLARSLTLLFVSLIALGCSPPAATPPTVSPTRANLTAEAAPVQVARTDSSESTLTQNETVTIGIDDRILVPEAGHARLDVGTGVEAHMYRGSEFSLAEARSEPGDALFAKLEQTTGCGKVRLLGAAQARVRLETAFGSITTLEPGTQFVVCHDLDVLTCLVVLNGEVEVFAEGKVVRVEAGEATFILKGKPPSPAICAQVDQVGAWMGAMEGTGKVRDLGDLVASWPQESCAVATTSAAQGPATAVYPTATSTAASLPPGEGMVRIPAGTYTLGYTDADEFHVTSFQQALPAFWIDAYEVTNRQYQAFLDATAHATPVAAAERKDFPVAGATWNDAAAFCAWAKKRLPNEAEWEVAARGPGPYPPLYPWGDAPEAGGKINDLPLTQTYQVGSMAFNVSPFGVYDMAGNVWEWVGNPYALVAQGMKVLRGGRYGALVDMAYRQQAGPADPRFVPVAGFRCAADHVAGE